MPNWEMSFGTYLLAFARMVGLFVQAPIWGSHHIPHNILVGAAASITLVMFPSLKVPHELQNADLFIFALLMMNQLLVGLLMGFISFLVMAAAQFAGELLDIQMGISQAASFDPNLKGGVVNLVRRWNFYFSMIIYLIMDGHQALIRIIQKSYEIIPLGGITFRGDIIKEYIVLTGNIFYLGIQIASPVLAAIFICQVALGLLARIAPQMNVFMLFFPLNITIGLLLLNLSFRPFCRALEILFSNNFHDLMRVIYMLGRG